MLGFGIVAAIVLIVFFGWVWVCLSDEQPSLRVVRMQPITIKGTPFYEVEISNGSHTVRVAKSEWRDKKTGIRKNLYTEAILEALYYKYVVWDDYFPHEEGVLID